MKFYTIRIQTKTDGTEVRNIAPFDDYNDAEIYYHKCLAADMGSAELSKVLVMVINDEGTPLLCRNFVQPVVIVAESED